MDESSHLSSIQPHQLRIHDRSGSWAIRCLAWISQRKFSGNSRTCRASASPGMLHGHVARVRHADFRAWSTSGTQDIVSVERIVA